MKGTVIYPQECAFQIDIPAEYQGSVHDELGYMWDAANPDSGNTALADMGLRIRPSMVGDIYHVNGETWMVDGMGFIRLTEADAVQVQKLPSRDRCMGWDWIKNHSSARLVIGNSIGCIK